MSKKEKRMMLFSAILIVLVMTGCSKKAQETGEVDGRNAEGLYPIRVLTPTTVSIFLIGDVLGFYQDEGIKMEFIGAAEKGVSPYQLMEMGKLDLTAGHPPDVAQARRAGIKVKGVTSAFVDNPDQPHVTYITQEDNPIKTLDDIVGKKVAIQSTGVCQEGYLKYYLKSRGLNADNVEFFVFGQQGLSEQSVLQGVTDIAAAHPPYNDKLLAAGGTRKVATSWDIFHSPGAGLTLEVVPEELIEKHPDVVQGLVNGIYKSRIWVNKHPEEAKKIFAEKNGIDPADLSVFYFDPARHIDPAHIDAWFEIAEFLDLWEKGEVSPEDIYTPNFVAKEVNEDWAKDLF
jgi:ABC-type nitrate/sulfonate/bicarbonate transport system substrate-binding protein